MSAYYNEFDPKAAAWIRQLIKNGMIADGEVDERSITEVTADEIRGFTQHHFFAGIGGWSYSLRLANWADSRPVCTASLPCQPFSVAGAQKGVDDERHLLPHFIELVKQCNFQTIFGEQVPGAIKHGWLDDLCTEMERESYSVGQIVLTAAGEGAPHIRQRLYWVADSSATRLQGHGRSEQESVSPGWKGEERYDSESSMANTSSDRLGRRDELKAGERNQMLTGSSSDNDGLVYTNGSRPQQGRESTEATGHWNTVESTSSISRMGDNSSERLEGGARESVQGTVDGFTSASSRMGDTEHDGHAASSEPGSYATSIRDSKTWTDSPCESERASASRVISEWDNPDWLYCRDEKYRPIKPGIKPLANGLPKGVGYSSDQSEPIDADSTQEARVMRLKGYGNAIVPQVASSFIQAFMATQ